MENKALGYLFYVCTLALLYPFLAFLWHHQYPILRADVFLTSLALLCVAGFTVVLNCFLPEFCRHILNSLVLTLALSILTGATFVMSLLFFIVLYGVFILFSTQVLPIFAIMLSAMCVTLLIQHHWPTAQQNVAIKRELPPILHIVLDEAAGYLPNKKIQDQFATTFKSYGFKYYPKTYARFIYTHFTLPSLFNFIQAPSPIEHWLKFASIQPNHLLSRIMLKKNAYFDALKKNGYRLHIIESSYLDVYPKQQKYAYTPCSVNAFIDANLSVWQHSKILIANFLAQSDLLAAFSYQSGIFYVDSSATVCTSLQVIERVKQEASSLSNGDFLYVHLLLPHYPYFYDEKCRVVNRPAVQAKRFIGPYNQRNTPDSRQQHYRAYLQQYQCTLHQVIAILDRLKARGIYDSSIIVIHGDHGSRISLRDPVEKIRAQLTQQDFIDSYSTLFTIKIPDQSAELSSQQDTLDSRFHDYLSIIGIKAHNINDKRIYLLKSRYQLGLQVPMPEIP